MKVLDYDGLDHSLAKLKVYLDSIRARDLADADDLCYVDPDEGVSVTIDDPGVTGTVLWGAESANQVALSVNGVSKLLLKSAAIAGIESSISTLSGYFINGSARSALSLGGHNAAYFAPASGLTALQEVVAGKQDTIVDLAAIRSGANHGETAYGWGNHASAGYATQSWVNGQLALYPYQIVVNGDAFGSVNGTVELPDYPTTLPASDVYAWAKASTKPSYNFSEIGSKPSTLSGYGITDAYISNGTIVLGSNSITPLTSHQSLSGYAHQVVVNGDAFEAVNSVIELPDYPTTLPASDVYAWAKKASLDVNDIPSITTGKISDLETWISNKGFITKAVNDLTNYYLKSETYTQTEVNNLIAAINQFHYEIYASTSAVTNPQSNVLYLIGPTGSGSDRYEEYVYSNSSWVKIGDTSIDLTGYVNDIVSAYPVGASHAFVSGIQKASNSSSLSIYYTQIYDWALDSTKPSYSLSEITGTTDLQAIEVLADNFPNGGILSYNHGSWQFDTNSYITGITSAMVVAALGYTPFNNASFTQANIQSTLGISNWALAANKPSYNFDEIGLKPLTLSGYGIRDAYFGVRTQDADRVPITLGDATENVLIAHQSLTGYVNAILPSAETDVYLCPDCDYFYDPAIGDPIGGIAVGTAFADLPSDWVCPICGASKEDFTAGGRQFVSGVSKSSGSSTISFTLNRLALRDLSGANNLKAIEYASGSGLLKRNADGTWGFDANSYLTGITSSMVTTALGYTPFNSANFTQANIQSMLGISNWALAASKPSYAFSELSSHPTTLSGYGITDAAAASDLLSYLPLAGGTMTGQLVVPSLKINGPTTDYAILASLAGTLYVSSDGEFSRPVFDTGNYTSYVYSKAQINAREGVLAAGIAGNSARLDSLEDWILGVNADTVGLGLVENVALSTWAGSGNITTLGTITTGVWQGTPIAANKLAIDFNWVLVGNAATYDTDDHVVVN